MRIYVYTFVVRSSYRGNILVREMNNQLSNAEGSLPGCRHIKVYTLKYIIYRVSGSRLLDRARAP